MRFGAFYFHPRTVPTLALLLLVSLFLWLGFWQLERAEYKRDLAAELELRAQQTEIKLDARQSREKVMKYRKVRVRGQFEPAKQVFIEGRKHQNKNGFHVVTPLKEEGAEIRVLVNRGWVPTATDGISLPPITTPVGLVEISGTVDIPEAPAITLGAESALPEWPARWPYLTVERFASGVDYPVERFVILQSPGNEHGFVRHWPRPMPSDGMHIGYAIQWFAFALIALIVYLALTISRHPLTVDS